MGIIYMEPKGLGLDVLMQVRYTWVVVPNTYKHTYIHTYKHAELVGPNAALFSAPREEQAHLLLRHLSPALHLLLAHISQGAYKVLAVHTLIYIDT